MGNKSSKFTLNQSITIKSYEKYCREKHEYAMAHKTDDWKFGRSCYNPKPFQIYNIKKTTEINTLLDSHVALTDIMKGNNYIILHLPNGMGKTLTLDSIEFAANCSDLNIIKRKSNTFLNKIITSRSNIGEQQLNDCSEETLQFNGTACKYPVLRLDFKNLFGNNIYEIGRNLLTEIYKTVLKYNMGEFIEYYKDFMPYYGIKWYSAADLEDTQKTTFCDFIMIEYVTKYLEKVLKALLNLDIRYKQKIVVLIDNYDAPFTDNNDLCSRRRRKIYYLIDAFNKTIDCNKEWIKVKFICSKTKLNFMKLSTSHEVIKSRYKDISLNGRGCIEFGTREEEVRNEYSNEQFRALFKQISKRDENVEITNIDVQKEKVIEVLKYMYGGYEYINTVEGDKDQPTNNIYNILNSYSIKKCFEHLKFDYFLTEKHDIDKFWFPLKRCIPLYKKLESRGEIKQISIEILMACHEELVTGRKKAICWLYQNGLLVINYSSNKKIVGNGTWGKCRLSFPNKEVMLSYNRVLESVREDIVNSSIDKHKKKIKESFEKEKWKKFAKVLKQFYNNILFGCEYFNENNNNVGVKRLVCLFKRLMKMCGYKLKEDKETGKIKNLIGTVERKNKIYAFTYSNIYEMNGAEFKDNKVMVIIQLNYLLRKNLYTNKKADYYNKRIIVLDDSEKAQYQEKDGIVYLIGKWEDLNNIENITVTENCIALNIRSMPSSLTIKPQETKKIYFYINCSKVSKLKPTCRLTSSILTRLTVTPSSIRVTSKSKKTFRIKYNKNISTTTLPESTLTISCTKVGQENLKLTLEAPTSKSLTVSGFKTTYKYEDKINFEFSSSSTDKVVLVLKSILKCDAKLVKEETHRLNFTSKSKEQTIPNYKITDTKPEYNCEVSFSSSDNDFTLPGKAVFKILRDTTVKKPMFRITPEYYKKFSTFNLAGSRTIKVYIDKKDGLDKLFGGISITPKLCFQIKNKKKSFSKALFTTLFKKSNFELEFKALGASCKNSPNYEINFIDSITNKTLPGLQKIKGVFEQPKKIELKVKLEDKYSGTIPYSDEVKGKVKLSRPLNLKFDPITSHELKIKIEEDHDLLKFKKDSLKVKISKNSLISKTEFKFKAKVKGLPGDHLEIELKPKTSKSIFEVKGDYDFIFSKVKKTKISVECPKAMSISYEIICYIYIKKCPKFKFDKGKLGIEYKIKNGLDIKSNDNEGEIKFIKDDHDVHDRCKKKKYKEEIKIKAKVIKKEVTTEEEVTTKEGVEERSSSSNTKEERIEGNKEEKENEEKEEEEEEIEDVEIEFKLDGNLEEHFYISKSEKIKIYKEIPFIVKVVNREDLETNIKEGVKSMKLTIGLNKEPLEGKDMELTPIIQNEELEGLIKFEPEKLVFKNKETTKDIVLNIQTENEKLLEEGIDLEFENSSDDYVIEIDENEKDNDVKEIEDDDQQEDLEDKEDISNLIVLPRELNIGFNKIKSESIKSENEGNEGSEESFFEKYKIYFLVGIAILAFLLLGRKDNKNKMGGNFENYEYEENYNSDYDYRDDVYEQYY